MYAEPRPAGYTRDMQQADIADFLNAECDATGQRTTNMIAASVKPTASRGRKDFERALIDMFDPAAASKKGRKARPKG
ncbi:hypothetical protein [Paracoccus yeei]|jgi:hypothetical protein|uniref:hypothetical protein n=1 Tax=Paracoccus yeei TaxID=147645 RepID=UPI003BF8BA58